jgi:hypothetical protein
LLRVRINEVWMEARLVRGSEVGGYRRKETAGDGGRGGGRREGEEGD